MALVALVSLPLALVSRRMSSTAGADGLVTSPSWVAGGWVAGGWWLGWLGKGNWFRLLYAEIRWPISMEIAYFYVIMHDLCINWVADFHRNRLF